MPPVTDPLSRALTRLVAACLLCCPWMAGAGAPGDAAEEVIAAERAMAKLFREKGLREAYLSNLAEDAVAFRAGPCLARPIHEKRPADLPVLFAWEPELVDVSLAGDLGYTFGPYHVYPNRTATEPVGQGHYLAFWRKQADGVWKSVVDVGIAHGKVDLAVARIRRPARTGQPLPVAGPVQSLDQAKAALLEIDRGFGERVRSQGWVGAYTGLAAEDFHSCIEGAYPTIGRSAAAEVLQHSSGAVAWRPQAAVVAASGDLGYTYGTRERSQAGGADAATERASYLRVWNRGPRGEWVLFLELVVPYPSHD